MSYFLRIAYMGLGGLMVALGALGAVLPGLPTTPFLLLAIWFFARSSPRLERYLLDHPTFGRPLRDWREKGSISRRAKCMSVAMMSLSYPLFLFTAHPSILPAALVALLMLTGAAYVLSRPSTA